MKLTKMFLPYVLLGAVVLAGVVNLGFRHADDAVAFEAEPVAMGETVVTVDDFRYSPRVIEVTPGTEVTWFFQDTVQHDVKSATFGSSRKKTGTFTQVFQAEGTYEYLCSLHPGMTGRVIVKQ